MDEDRPAYKKYEMISPPSDERKRPTPTELHMVEHEENEENAPGRKPATLIVVGSLIVVGLIIAGLFLPPISLGKRLGLGQEAVEEVPETAVIEPLSLPGQIDLALSQGSAGVAAGPGDADSGSLAAIGTTQGSLYAINYEGDPPTGSAALTIPPDAGPLETLDLYGWDAAGWHFIPSQINSSSQQIVSIEGPLPRALAMIQTAPVTNPAIGAELLPTQELPVDILPQLTEVTAGTLTLVGEGELQGEAVDVPTGAYDQFLRITNTGAIVDQESLSALLSDTAVQNSHIQALVDQVVAGDYAGLNLDYQGVQTSQNLAFTSFVTDLAAALDDQERSLAITLATPQRVNTSWDTAGQDWTALSQAADAVYLQMPLNPTVYTPDGVGEQLLDFATRQIDRRKLVLLTSASAVDKIGESFRELPNVEALANFGELQFVQGDAEVEPGTPIEVALSGTASPLEWDGSSLTYKYSYEQSGQTHHVWLGNEASLSQRLNMALTYNLHGVAVRGLGNVTQGAGFATAFNSYLGQAEAPQPAGAAIVWRVQGENDNVLASSSGEALSFSWDGVEEPGEYSINVEFALGDNLSPLDSLTVQVLEPPEPVVEEPEEPEEETTELAAATSFNPGDADGVVNTGANVRVGPGLGYATIAGGAEPGTKIKIIGRSADSAWLNIIMPDGETEGWIFATLVTLNPRVKIAALPVIEAPPLVAGGDDGGGGTAPPPVTAPPVTNAGFELGGQAFGAPYGMMSYAGMNWVKKQHKWSPGQSGTAVAGTISEAHNAGFKILLSIPGVPYPSSLPDFGAYVQFLREVASLPDPPNAIEVWNEQNINAEWPAGQIDPASYVNNMLAPAYNAIKSANGNIMVISGAPAPTGFFGGGCGTNGCDDAPYVAGMAAAGAASYMDCVGVHYNEGIISPNQQSGDPRSEHYTRYFWGMVNAYWNAVGGARPLCFTELGYLTPEGYGGLPGNFSWAANTSLSQQAQWLAEAASLSAGSGKVRMMIVWNIDSTTWTSDPQAGYAIIRPGGGCAACETLRAVMGR